MRELLQDMRDPIFWAYVGPGLLLALISLAYLAFVFFYCFHT